MADTTVTSPSVKKYVDYSQQQVDEQAILDKYNAATVAQYNLQREQNRAAENQFYNQMYNTQKTAMDTIRQSNAAAVASGASRGVQAANELSAILGLQQESVQGATEIAQANRQTAQEETAAILENVLAAYQQATQERQALVQQGIEAASVDAQEAANQIAAQEAETNRMNAETNKGQLVQQTETQREQDLAAAALEGIDAYLETLSEQTRGYDKEYSEEGARSLDRALSLMTQPSQDDFDSWIGNLFNTAFSTGNKDAVAKLYTAKAQLQKICDSYGIDSKKYMTGMNNIISYFKDSATGKQADAYRSYREAYTSLLTAMQQDYAKKKNTETKTDNK